MRKSHDTSTVQYILLCCGRNDKVNIVNGILFVVDIPQKHWPNEKVRFDGKPNPFTSGCSASRTRIVVGHYIQEYFYSGVQNVYVCAPMLAGGACFCYFFQMFGPSQTYIGR